VANEQNLKPFDSSQNREEAKKNGKKGGVASGAARRKKGAARKMLMEVLAFKPVITPALRNGIVQLGGDPDTGEYTTEMLMQIALAQKVMKGDTKAYELYMKTIGEDPATVLEERKLQLEKEAVKAIRNSDGFMEAMNGMAGEVFADGGDTPDAVEDE